MALITELDDRMLVEAHQAGDDDAFRQIVERHRDGLQRHAYRRLGDATLAEDAVQETMFRAFRALPRFEGDYRLDAWLHRILTNVCFDLGRRQGRDGKLFDKVASVAEVFEPAVDDAIPDDDPALVAALEALPEGYRDVLVMRLVDELPYTDVAARAGISEDNARARVSRGRSMLRTMLSGAASAVVWLIPPLRRNDVTGSSVQAADGAAAVGQAVQPVASIAAPAASAAPAMSSASAFVANAAPALVHAAPAASSSAPVLGKAAVAVGIAATVAIPAGRAVEERLSPAPPATAPAADDADVAAPGDPVEVTPSPTEPQPGSQTIAGGVALDPDAAADPTTSVPSAGSADGSDDAAAPADDGTDPGQDDGAAAPTTSAPAPSGHGAGDPDTGSGSEPPAPTPAPAPTAGLDAGLAVTPAGARMEISGPFSLQRGDDTVSGSLTGKVLVGEADPKDPEAPRAIEGDLTLTFADGSVATLRFRGSAVVTDRDGATVHDLTAVLRLAGGAPHGLAEDGELRGTFGVQGESGTLALRLPTADDTAGGQGSQSDLGSQSGGTAPSTSAPEESDDSSSAAAEPTA